MKGLDPGTTRARILVVDDDAGTRAWLVEFLSGQGYDVVAAEDGQTAVERFGHGEFDAVLVDVVMPGVSGLDVSRRLRAEARSDEPLGTRDVPVLVTLARSDTRSRVEALSLGVHGFLAKPFEPEEILAALGRAVTIKRSEDRVRRWRTEVSHLRRTDPLTGALSFAAVAALLSSEFARAEEHAEPLACCLVDVDGLRTFNARGGRPVGDELLRSVAAAMLGSVREADVVARYGDDEFLVVLPGAPFSGAMVAASRIVRAVDELGAGVGAPWSGGDLTVSIGVALYPSRDVRTAGALVEAAAIALGDAKFQGGNRVCVFQQSGAFGAPSRGP